MLNRRMRGGGGIGPMQPGMYGAGRKTESLAASSHRRQRVDCNRSVAV